MAAITNFSGLEWSDEEGDRQDQEPGEDFAPPWGLPGLQRGLPGHLLPGEFW